MSVRADEPHFSQRPKKHGMNVQAITRPDGTPLWSAPATPGRTDDLAAARTHGTVQACLTGQILAGAAVPCGNRSLGGDGHDDFVLDLGQPVDDFT